MSRDSPFVFEAGGGHPPAPAPPSHSQHQQQQNQPASNLPPQAQSALAQQMAFQQNAQLPAGIDMSVLSGISPQQLATIARLIQSGALPLPPEPASQVSDPNPATPVPQSSASTTAFAQKQDMDMDKEEGEVEEGEVSSTPQESEFLRPPTTSLRNLSWSPHGQSTKQDGSKASSKSAMPNQKAQRGNAQLQHAQALHANGIVNGTQQADKEAAAKMFVLQMFKAGKTFDDLAKEIRSPKALRRMFKQLGLPIQSGPSSGPLVGQNGTAAEYPMPKPSSGEEVRKASTKRQAPAKPVDRSEYLARLQAAKNKKTEPTAAAPAPSRATAKPTAPAQAPQQVQETASTQTPPPRKAVAKNELIRQRLEALKAEQAAKQKGSPQSTKPVTESSPISKHTSLAGDNQQSTSSPLQHGLGAGIAEIPVKAANIMTQQPQVPPQPLAIQTSAPSAVSPAPPTPNSAFGALPGLFMAGSPSQASPPTHSQQSATAFQPTFQPASTLPTSTTQSTPQSAASPAVPRKRAVAADFDDTPAKSDTTKRPFGQSRNASEDESMIIEVSEDEYSDSEAEEGGAAQSAANTDTQTKSFRDVAPLSNFSQRPNFPAGLRGPSYGTPGSYGHGGPISHTTYEQRMKEIEAMKQKIAAREMEKRKTSAATSSLVKGKTLNDVTDSSNAPTPVPAEESFATPDGHSTPKTAETQGVTAAAVDPEPVPAIQQRIDTREGGAQSEASNGEASEEGELSDESVSKLYGDQEDASDEGEEQNGLFDPAAYPSADELDRDEAESDAGAAPVSKPQRESFSPPASSDSEMADPDEDSYSVSDDLEPRHIDTMDGLHERKTTAHSPQRISSQSQDSQEEGEIDENDTYSETSEDFEPEPAHVDSTIDDVGEDAATPVAAIADAPAVESSLKPTYPPPDDDLAPELQPEDEQESNSHQAPPRHPQNKTSDYYTPYQSPLTGLKSFRWHPNFLSLVPGGFRSLTYNHKIDPDKPLCYFEGAGGQCNDRSGRCGGQHWKDMQVSDSELLKNLGSKDIPSDDLDAWNRGLGEVIAGIRVDPAFEERDVDAIAARISEFRRKFLGGRPGAAKQGKARKRRASK